MYAVKKRRSMSSELHYNLTSGWGINRIQCVQQMLSSYRKGMSNGQIIPISIFFHNSWLRFERETFWWIEEIRRYFEFLRNIKKEKFRSEKSKFCIGAHLTRRLHMERESAPSSNHNRNKFNYLVSNRYFLSNGVCMILHSTTMRCSQKTNVVKFRTTMVNWRLTIDLKQAIVDLNYTLLVFWEWKR